MKLRIAVVLLAAGSYAAAEDPKLSKGTQIGQTINDAIEAALPGTKLIFDAIKAILPDGSKVKKSDVEDAVQKGAAQAREVAVKAANDQLKRFAGIVKEIEITTELGDNARKAGTDLTVIRSMLTGTMASLTDPQWERLNHEWKDLAKKSLTNVVAFDEKKLSQISDPDIQKELATLKKNSERDIDDFENQITARNQSLALTLLLQITQRLDNVSSAPAVQLKSFGDQLAALAAGKQGTPDQPVPPPPPLKSGLMLLLQDTNARFNKS